MLDFSNETAIKFSAIPDWCHKNLGNRVNRSTCHRWRTRGARGIKLETALVGGTRYTTLEALNRFFAETTAAADGETYEPASARQTTAEGESCGAAPKRQQESPKLAQAEAYLESEGI